MNTLLQPTSEVRAALADGAAVVALESTLIAHGMPWPANLETAHRLLRASWQDLAHAATWRAADIHTQLGARMLDRLGQLMPRLGASRGRLASDGFTELQIGYCTLALQRALPSLPPAARKPIRRVLSIVARHFRARARAGHVVPVPMPLRQWLDTSIGQVMAARGDNQQMAAVLSALVVLRLTMQTHEKND